MDIREKIIKNYPLDKKIDCALDCYMLAKKKIPDILEWFSIQKFNGTDFNGFGEYD